MRSISLSNGSTLPSFPRVARTAIRLVMRRFASSPLQLIASPDYVARRDSPRSISELNQHVFLSHSGKRLNQGQLFLEQAGPMRFEAETQIVANSLEMIHRLSIEGHGIAALPEYLVGSGCQEVR